MLLKDIQPFVRLVLRACLHENSNDVFKTVRTRDNRLFFVINGCLKIYAEGACHHLNRNSLALIRSGIQYKIEPVDNVTLCIINFDYTDIFSSLQTSFHPFSADFPGTLEDVRFDDAPALSSCLVLHDGACFYDSLQKLVSIFHATDQWREPSLSATMKALLLDIARSFTAQLQNATQVTDKANEILRYLQENYAMPIDGEVLSRKFHFTPVYINRLFQKQMGLSLHKYLIGLRIDMAKKLLMTGAYTPSETAELVGFEDYPHFSKTFKRYTGLTPSRYRSAHK